MSLTSCRCINPRRLTSFSLYRNVCSVFSSQQSIGCLVSPQQRGMCTQTGGTDDADKSFSKPLSENDVVNPNFINRNPRNLEQMGLAQKQGGWRFHYPSKNFFHKLFLDMGSNNTSAKVVHCSGRTVVSASTKEVAIAKHLYSNTDVSAAENIGRVIAQRCQECGITEMELHDGEISQESTKFQKFVNALEDGGLTLTEPYLVERPYEPGINYDDEEEVNNLHERQQMAGRYGELTTLALKARLRSRRSLKKATFKHAPKLERPIE